MADIFSQFFKRYKKAKVALSGGADSACVLMLAVEHMGRENVTAVTCVNSHFFGYELATARLIAVILGVEHEQYTADMPAEFYLGDADRCYHCKRAILSALPAGDAIIFDGTTADDNPSDRPGHRALTELNIVSPLRELGLGKGYVQKRCRELDGITFHDESCKATRLSGTIDTDRMDAVDAFEGALRDRLHGIRYRIDEGRVIFKSPVKIEEKDFELINEVKRTNRRDT